MSSRMSRPISEDSTAGLSLSVARYLALALGAMMALAIAFLYPLSSTFDELEHLSVVQSQHAQPRLFPAYEDYRVLAAPDYRVAGETPNYINHPAPYYLVASLFYGDGEEGALLRLRLFNVALFLGGLALLAQAVIRFADAPIGLSHSTAAFLLLSLPLFPKAPLAGLVNNDNLGWLAVGCVFYGLSRRAFPWLAAGILLAGWMKLTAFLGLGLFVGCWRLLSLHSNGKWRLTRGDAWLALAYALALIPYIANVLRYGAVVWTNDAHFAVTPELRVEYDFAAFIPYFLSTFALKWQAADGLLPILFPFWAGIAFLFWGAWGVATPARDISRVALLAFAAVFLIHFTFAWQAYTLNGDLTNAQIRYYNVLWPGLVFSFWLAVEKGRECCGRSGRYLRPFALLLLLLPTWPVALFFATR